VNWYYEREHRSQFGERTKANHWGQGRIKS